MCSYVAMMPYFLPISFVLGFLFGYAIPQITKKEKLKFEDVANLFEGEERELILAALNNKMQSEVSEKMGKVRVFRTLRKLTTNGLVEKEKEGNSYRLKAGRKLKQLLR